MLRFLKMQGCGNDYVFIDCRKQQVASPERLARVISDRHFGVGSDGLVLMLPSGSGDLRMQIYNADGSEAGMCGNAARCCARYAWGCGWVSHEPLRLATKSGIRELRTAADGLIALEMGRPETRELPEVRFGGRKLLCLSLGNPHAVLPVREVSRFPLEQAAREVQAQADVNLEIFQPLAKNHLRARVYERGSGETLACGTGACAVAVAAVLRGFCERDAEILVEMPGGKLRVRWRQAGSLVLTGDAREVFSGEWEESQEDRSWG